MQRRCAVDHELAHVELGHVGGCSAANEQAARLRSSRRLLPVRMLAQALAFTLDLDAVAWDCWVTPRVLGDRLSTLDPGEHDRLMAATEHHRESAA